MIPVVLAAAPTDFKSRIRQRGLDAIAELVGELPEHARPGPKREKIADSRDTIPAKAFPPYWREVLPDMLASYKRLCAYLALYIEHATGSPSVDHVVPKSKAWDKVYEWSNYRLACSLVNACKSDLELVLDPFTIATGLFALEFVAFQVKPGPSAQGAVIEQVKKTVETLGLNADECCTARRTYVENYELGPDNEGIGLGYLTRRAPFIAQELRRQGRLLRGDA
jgi:5-methylcytosine-specific restriction endonuclease McrA